MNKLTDENIEDLSLSVNEDDLSDNKQDLDEDLRPLPSPSPTMAKPVANVERSKSIDQINQEKSTIKNKNEKPKIEKSISESASKPAYSFLGFGGGGGLSKPKKPKVEFPRMKRDEFRCPAKLRFTKEGDDYYYSLKENQYSIGEKTFDKDVINSVHISNRERKERIYSQKYTANLEHLESYLMVTQHLTKFTLEFEIDGATGEEEEAIVIEDSSINDDLLEADAEAQPETGVEPEAEASSLPTTLLINSETSKIDNDTGAIENK